MKSISCEEMKKYEIAGDEAGLTFYNMMENAGHAAFKLIMKITEPTENTSFAVFCGKGGNGGDGLVIARLLSKAGMKVSVILVEGNPVTEDALKNFNLLRDEVIYNSIPGSLTADVVIDGIYGTGYKGSLRPRGSQAVKLINSMRHLGSTVISIDIPSGLKGDVMPDEDLNDSICVYADHTITFHRKKYIHDNKSAEKFCGKVSVVDIGIDTALDTSYFMNSRGYAVPYKHNISMNAAAVCIILHGFQSSMESPTAKMLMTNLPKDGICTFAFDFPGHGESYIPMNKLTVEDCTADLADSEKFIRQLVPDADIFYFGSSFGAYTVLNHLGVGPHLATKAFLRSCAVNMDEITPKVHNLPNFWKDNNENALDCKILMVHGTDDEDVPYEKASTFAETFNIPLITIEHGDHRLSRDGMPERVYQLAKDFFTLDK